MIFSLFSQNPGLLIPFLLAIFYCFTIHEFAHAWSAYLQGDDTAKSAGRLTLNPIVHIDLVGLLMFMVAGFGWAKPTPVNPNNFKNGKRSDIIVSLAGIGANVVSLIVFTLVFKLLFPDLHPLYVYSQAYVEINMLAYFLATLIVMNLILAIFNLIPVPPLDGSHVLLTVLPDRFNRFKAGLAQNGPIVLLMLIMADNFLGVDIFGYIFSPFINLLNLFFR